MDSVSTVPSVFLNSTVDPKTPTGQLRQHKSALGQDDFLKLLVTKMTAQDPMNPQGDTEFIAQMAQFSALEQSRAMTADMAELREQQEVLTANELIGRAVILNDGEKNIGEGLVTSVAMLDGIPVVVVGGKNYDLDQVSNISPYTVVA